MATLTGLNAEGRIPVPSGDGLRPCFLDHYFNCIELTETNCRTISGWDVADSLGSEP